MKKLEETSPGNSRLARSPKQVTEGAYCRVPTVEDVNELMFETMALEKWVDSDAICFLTLSEALVRYLRKYSIDVSSCST